MNIPIDPNSLLEFVKKSLITLTDFWNNRELLESHIEGLVFEHLYKFNNEQAELIPQRTINTISGNFRPDIILKIGDKEISIECDGEEFHQDDYYDEWRDALILVSSNIKSIFRLRGKDIYTDLDGIIYFLATKEPDFFNMDMIRRLKLQVRQEFLFPEEYNYLIDKKIIIFEEQGLDGALERRMMEITWRNLSRSFSVFWLDEILTSYLNPGKPIEELKALKAENSIKTEDLLALFYDKYAEYKIV